MAKSDDTVLLVDDDAPFRKVLAALLEQAQIGSIQVGSAEEALVELNRSPVDVMIVDLRMPGMGGMDLLSQVAQSWSDVPVVVLTAHGSVALAVEAMKKGAADFMQKPFDREEVLFVVRKALLSAKHERSRRTSPVHEHPNGASAAMAALHWRVQRAAGSAATVLIRGETGTGKELVARAIHEQSERRAFPFVRLNCAALPDSLLESELFGHEKGAFTGAVARKPGRVELAAKGTLFLDEIGDVPLATQVKLLRVLQERQFERVGGVDTIDVDVRFVAATHRPLEEMIDRGQFREDLFYRLNVIPLDIPPLRERPGEIERLVRCFAERSAAANGRPEPELGPGVVELLSAEPWPGNVRQLENLVERLIVFAEGPSIDRSDVERELQREAARHTGSRPPGHSAARDPAQLGGPSSSLEVDALLTALDKSNNNRTLAARLLGVSRSTLYNKLREFGLD